MSFNQMMEYLRLYPILVMAVYNNQVKMIRYHAHKITLDKNNCTISLKDVGKPGIGGHTVKVVDTDTGKVNGVLITKITAFDSHQIKFVQQKYLIPNNSISKFTYLIFYLSLLKYKRERN